jgi:ABC-type nitrate/sulfonate/bicarbonate transport system ATPase subunit
MRAEGAMKAQGEAVELSEAGFGFGELEVLAGVSISVAPGEVVALVGPSGCGKSTLLELVAGLHEPNAGRVVVGGEPAAATRHAALMPQRDCLLPWLDARDNAALALRNRGLSRGEARAQAEPLLARFGLGGFLGSAPRELSGGMRQRVAFARTLLAQKPVIVLDEPFASLDAITRAQMQEWLADALAGEARTVVMVSHDVEESLYLADRVLVLSERPARVVVEVSSPAPRSHPRSAAVAEPAFLAARAEATAALGGPG